MKTWSGYHQTRLYSAEVIASGLMRSGRLEKLFWYSSLDVVAFGLLLIFMLTPWFRSLEAFPSADLLLRILGVVVGIVGFSPRFS